MAEPGIFALILAFIFSLLLMTVPAAGLKLKRASWVESVDVLVYSQFFFISFAYLCLTVSFLQNDFSVNYVALNSSIPLPWFYKLCAVWGGHEGSMLLWVSILSAWMLAVSFFSRHLEQGFRVRVLVILGALSAGFILFLLSTSNPFARQFVSLNIQGRDLNPLLQDPGFLFHPPMLYMGYVGFSVAFAFAAAALSMGRLETDWAKWTRPWTLAAWCCLTTGITLGSWWAYRELGWGGWWFWDPVENASFMPWLAGTALIHSLAVSEKRQQFVAWTLLLAIMVFSLSLIGTFLVRSGVLTSVHAFAVDPARGNYILWFLLVVIGGSLLLFALRAKTLQVKENPALLSRESALLLNNVFLAVMMFSVLLGTVYPLIVDGLGLGKLSVGAPYFNAVFVPLAVPLLILMGLGVHLNWQRDHWRNLKFLAIPAAVSFIVPAGLQYFLTGQLLLTALTGIILALWVTLGTLMLAWRIYRLRGIRGFSQAFWGMIAAHLGVAMVVAGIAVSSGYGIQDDVRLAPGGHVFLAGYRIDFLKSSDLTGPNYTGTQAVFRVSHDQRSKLIYPEKRIYTIAQMAMTDSAIDVNPFRDIYVALGEPLDQDAWSVRVYYKPLVRWIWAGGFMILAGGLLALSDRRYYTPLPVPSRALCHSLEGGNPNLSAPELLDNRIPRYDTVADTTSDHALSKEVLQ